MGSRTSTLANRGEKIWNNINKDSQFANFREKTEYKLGSAFKDLDLSTDETLEI